MLSKEEVLDIISYCAENGISRKVRLKELGIPVWQFYYSRDRWLEKERSEPVGEGKFIELRRNGRFVPASISQAEESVNPRVSKPKEAEDLRIELQTPRGGLMRISGKVSASFLSSILQTL